MSPIKLLNNAQTAELIGVRPNTLEIWRIQGKGPAYRKVGRLVRYIEAEVQPTITTLIGLAEALDISASNLVQETEAEYKRGKPRK